MVINLRCNLAFSRWRFALLLFLCQPLSTAFAVLDDVTVNSCAVFHTELNVHERQTLHDLVQALQATEAHLSALRLGRQHPAGANQTVLSSYRDTILQKLHNLVESARIVSQAGLR